MLSTFLGGSQTDQLSATKMARGSNLRCVSYLAIRLQVSFSRVVTTTDLMGPQVSFLTLGFKVTVDAFLSR